MNQRITAVFVLLILWVLGASPSHALDLQKLGKKALKKTNTESPIKELKSRNPCKSDKPERECVIDFLEIKNKDGYTWQIETKFMHDMEIIHKPGLQIKIYDKTERGNPTYSYFSQMEVYGLLGKNKGKSEIDMSETGKNKGSWISKDNSESIKVLLNSSGQFPKSLTAKVIIHVKGSKPVTKSYNIPFDQIDTENSIPEIMAKPTEGKHALLCRNKGDKCLDNFKVRELDKDWEIQITPIQRECGDKGYNGMRPCIQLRAEVEGVRHLITHSLGLSHERKKLAKDKVFEFTDISKEGNWISKDKTQWIKHSLIVGKKAKARVEVKLNSYGKPLVKEYELPFSL